jgi:hypothetical protein
MKRTVAALSFIGFLFAFAATASAVCLALLFRSTSDDNFSARVSF